MRRCLPLFIAGCAALLIVGSTSTGCGGGGGGGGSSSGGGSGGGAFSLSPATLTVGPNGQIFLVARSGSAQADVTWSSTSGIVTPLGTGLALYTAPATGSATVTATTTAAPQRSDSTAVTINASLATVRGRVVSDATFNGVANVVIEFKNGTTTLATATTLANGYFTAGVPPTATRFHVRNTTVPSGFWKQYTFDSERFTTLDSNCTAPLPALAAGTSVALATDVRLNAQVGPPPPPPTGCP